MMRRAVPWMMLLALAVMSISPALGHEGEGSLEVLVADRARPLEVDYRVRVTFRADGHPVGDATVTAVAERDGAPPVAPVRLEEVDEEGVYAGTVRFPTAGTWTLRFTAVTPAATLERSETVEGPVGTTAIPTSAPAPPASNTTGDSDRGTPSVFLLGVTAAAILAVTAFLVRRRMSRMTAGPASGSASAN